MKLVVCLKHVPAPGEPARYLEERRLSREDVQGVAGALDEHALETALALRAAHPGCEVVVLGMGPPEARDSLRRVQARGVDQAIHLCDPALAGSDLGVTARVLAAAIARLEDVGLVLLGARSADAASGALGAMLAAHLDWPLLAHAARVTLTPPTRMVDVVQPLDVATLSRAAAWPAIVTCVAGPCEPAPPSFSGIMQATRQELVTWELATLGLAPDEVGLRGATTLVVEVAEPVMPPPPPGVREELGELVAWLRSVRA